MSSYYEFNDTLSLSSTLCIWLGLNFQLQRGKIHTFNMSHLPLRFNWVTSLYGLNVGYLFMWPVPRRMSCSAVGVGGGDRRLSLCG
jgi:hypothetical protein